LERNIAEEGSASKMISLCYACSAICQQFLHTRKIIPSPSCTSRSLETVGVPEGKGSGVHFASSSNDVQLSCKDQE
jgi:hypothetical protein